MNNLESPLPIVMFYHDIAFRYLINKHHREIDDALFARPLQLRKKEFLPNLPVNQPLFDEDAWSLVYDYLLQIESELKQVIERCHIAVWLHLYRRIGVTLSSRHQGKTDQTTVGLVRRTAELAFAKYGNKDPSYSVALSGSLRPADLLGGQFVASAVASGASFQQALDMAQGVIDSNQWVLADFTPEMLIATFWVEGLCYEHWLTAAMLRAIGKGAGIVHKGNDWPFYLERDRLRDLIIWYDKRIESQRFFSTLAGTLVSTRTLKVPHPARHALTPVYNTARRSAREAFGKLGSTFSPEFVPNFLLVQTPLYEFKKSVEYLASEFERLYGYTIDDLCVVIAALSMICMVPPGVLEGRRKEERQQVLRDSFIHLAQRAYKLTGMTNGELLEYAEILASTAHWEFPSCTKMGLERAFEALHLRPDQERYIGLWSGGKWFPIIDIADGKIVNLVGIHDLLFRLFVGVRDKLEARGDAFEVAFRAALTEQKFNVIHHGELRFNDGSKREVDAAVRRKKTLVIFECRAMERPLDYDIGRPKTMKSRKADFETKVDQVLTLRDKLAVSKKGRNFDFSWANNILAYVVSPFVEFIYEYSDDMVDGEWPRILSVDEAMSRLRSI